MIYKNSMKLLTSNFSLVWKQLAYSLIRLTIILGLTMLVSRPIVNLLTEQGFFQSITTTWQSVYTNTETFFVALKDCIQQFFSIISQHIGNLRASIVLFFIVIVIINAFLKYVGKYALTYVAHNNFTSLTKCNYSHSIISNIKNILKYSACRFLLDLPFTALKMLFIYIYCVMAQDFVMAIVGITLMIVLFTITYALQISVYNGLAAEQISHNKHPFKSVLKTYSSSKELLKIFSNAIIVVVTIIVVNVIIGIFTVGAGLFITIPASMVLVVIFELISYYTQTKQRYYLSATVIVDVVDASKVEKF